MKTESLSTIKNELQSMSRDEILDILIKLIKQSEINKEYTTYQIFYSPFEEIYVKEIKQVISDNFCSINTNNAYLTKKSIRKIIKTTNKYVRFSKVKTTEVAVRFHFCQNFVDGKFHLIKDEPLKNLYRREIEKIKKTVMSLHEDLQSDYLNDLSHLKRV